MNATIETRPQLAPTDRGVVLVHFARARLREALGGPKAQRPWGPWFQQRGATFVTLRWRGGALQGCIGSIEAERTLVDDVGHNAVAAGTRDPRALPIGLADVDELDVELSILSPLEELTFTNEREARAALRPGVDGVVLGYHLHLGTFLPVMWETFGDAATLLDALKSKAGLDEAFWDDGIRLWRYTVERFVDPAPSRIAATGHA